MPVQFPPQDRRADLVFEGYQALGAGIGSGVRSLGEALEKRRDESKRLNAAGKAAKAFLKATGEDPMETEAMSFRDAIGKMTGRQTAQDYKRGVADTARFLASAAREQEELSNAERYPDYAGRLVDAAEPSISQKQDFYEGVGAGGTEMPTEAMRPTARALTARDFLEASAASKYRMGTPDVRLLEATDTQGDGNEGPFEFVEDPVSGSRFARSRKTVLPSGTNPDKVISTEEVELADGEVVTIIRTGRGTQIIRKREPKGEVTELEGYRSRTRRLIGLLGRKFPKKEEQAEIARLRGELEAMDRGEPPGTAAPTATPTTPKTLTLEQAIVFLKQAKGDKVKARELARDAGYGF